MSDFEKYIEAKYPNRSPKILFQKFKDIDGTLFYGVKEIEDQAEVWSHQQAIIDQLNSVLDERTKEWLQAIELGAYFENVAKPLKEENDRLKAQLSNMEACCIEKKKEVEDQHKKVDEVLEYLNGESANRWGLWKEKADMLDQGASNAFEEAYWMVKKVLRGAND